jgi:hypothetical protein
MKDRTTFSNKIKLNDLAYDAAIFIFPLILGQLYGRLMAFRPLGLPFVQLFLAGTVYFLPLLIGKMYNVDFRDSSERVRKCVLVILFATMFFAYGNLLYLVMPTIDQAGSYGKFLMVTATIFLIMGPIAGLMFTKKDAPRVEGASTQMVVFLMTMGFLPLFFILISGEEIFGNTGFLLSLLIIIGLITGDVVLIVLIYAAYSKYKKMLIKAGAYDTCVFIIRLLTPFCVSFLLLFFNINSDRLFMTGIGTKGAWSILLVIFFYVATGVFPLRILMMLTPPVKPVNIYIGIASAVFLILVVVLT